MKKLIALLLALALCLGLAACGGDDTPATTAAPATEDPQKVEKPNDGSWAIYWYLCGSDLETNGGFATTDLMEMMQVKLPENVNVVIQTGGAKTWQNEYVDSSKTQRWLYNSEGFKLIDEQPLANMGEAQTLYDFLYFANTNYPADKVAVTFWNHGGGSVSGAAFDELHELDSLDLGEMYQAFDAVWPANTSNPALELVGFDTCLMATIDVAAVFQNFSKYLVASEEVEPGNGWLYSGWMGELAKNPTAMDGDDLGIAICNTYYEGCQAVGTEDQATLSLTDLTKLKPYGDTMNDGKVQTSFTLPVKDDAKGEEAARQIAKKMGLEEPNVAFHQALDKEFTFYVVYGSCVHSINYDDIHVMTVESDVMSMEETNEYIQKNIGRKVVMVGASTGTDAHTVGIDAIMNRKGFAGHYGVERYEMIEAYNLGSQVPNEEFIQKALELKADVLLVSQTVTQKDVHIQNLTELIELLEAEGLRDKFVVVCGGPRITHELAKELGYDAGFGAGTYGDDVASFAVAEMVKRGMK